MKDNIIFNLIWSGVLVLLAIFVLFLHDYLGQNGKRRSIIKFIEEHLMTTVIVIIVSGFALYSWGYWEGNNAGNLIVMLPKAIVSALGMFVSSSDMVDLKSEMKDNVLYMTLFTVVHFSALLVSILVMLKVLGYKFRSFIRMHFKHSSRKTLVFWGINENSLMLAESIQAESIQDVTIVFVELPSIEKYDYNPLVGLLNRHNIQRPSICRMEHIGAYLIKAQRVFQDINQDKNSFGNNIYSALGLNALNSFMRDAKEVQFYFLSDVQQENMDNLMDIIKFYGVDHFNEVPISKIYCHARRDSLNGIIGRISDKIQFADSSYLSVLHLLKKVERQPANFVDVDYSNGVVTSPFNALIVGFEDTGCDVFRFLYEFSAFVGKDGEPAPRTIHVMDEKLSVYKTRFLNNSPALKGKQDINWWEDMSIGSPNFWNKYQELINQLNYIVIVLPDDKMALEIAIKMYQIAYRYRENFRYFKIFVHLKDTDSAQLLDHVSQYYKESSDRDDRGTNTLEAFGMYSSIFNAEIFDMYVVDVDAKKFKKQYDEYYNDMFPQQSNNVETPKVEKHVNIDVKQHCNHLQNVSNVRHIDTKLMLAGAYDGHGNLVEKRMEFLRKIAMQINTKYVNSYCETADYILLKNISRCEHLRWNAKMELLGFVPYSCEQFPKAENKDYTYKTHFCIVSCKELETSLRSYVIYDWIVVKLSFMYYNTSCKA